MTTDLGPRLTAKQVVARYIHSLQDGSREALAAFPGLGAGIGDPDSRSNEEKRKVI